MSLTQLQLDEMYPIYDEYRIFFFKTNDFAISFLYSFLYLRLYNLYMLNLFVLFFNLKP